MAVNTGKKKRLSAALIGIALLAGCSMAPKYVRPDTPVEAAFPQGEAYRRDLSGAPRVEELTWRQFFGDEKLIKVIALALENNRDLRAAVLNVEQARALYGIQRSEMLPAVDASAAGSRQRVPADISPSGRRRISESYSVNLGLLSWEIDFFGRLASLKDEALEEYLASEEGRRAAQISLISSVANTWLTLAADRENLKLARSTLVAQKATCDMIRQRYEVGIASELDLRQVQTQVDTARVNEALYLRLAAQDKNALDLLAGTSVGEELLPADLGEVKPLREVAAGLSSEVLFNRPDILRAEHQLKAANAYIGVARAAFFPRISLTATVGRASAELSGLFKNGHSAWDLAPQASLPVLDPRTWYALKASKAQQKIAVTQYEKTVQSAFREVADTLAARGTMDTQLKAQTALVAASERTYKLYDLRYRLGADSYLGVLDAQRSLYAAQQNLVAVRLAKLTSQVLLYAALGGGCDL
ncbi:MAG: efflux transporter outer membrane subunit [Desulfovibrionaceae bacterium]|nr:efflux transporter outer membrane subunit [Desulfovibrionaceae bacterium]